MLDKTKIGHDISIHELIKIKSNKNSYWNLVAEELMEKAITNGEGKLAKGGALLVDTGKYTGRSPKDKFIVKDSNTENRVDWGTVNQPITNEKADILYNKCIKYMEERDLYITDVWAGAEAKYRIGVRFINVRAYHNLFAQNMFIKPTIEERTNFKPDFTVLHCPTLKADPKEDSTRSETFIVMNITKKYLLIGGTEYSGEMKKGIFSLLNYLLPEQNVLPMHCSANTNDANETAVFFGLSGTGKTTLSADLNRILIGDDEHAWSEQGIFNFEGGCYAKIINLEPKNEPMIYKTTKTFGTIIENAVVDSKRIINFQDNSKTSNTRSSYPLSQLSNASKENKGDVAQNIIMLTCDAFGILPAVSLLSANQAMFHFLSGYTAKVAGTERGVTEPEATFSACFGAPFMPRHPCDYANLLGEKIKNYKVNCWLVNTGWQGGAYGVGQRISLLYTRAIINNILDATLIKNKFVNNVFKLQTPVACNSVPIEILNPSSLWNSEAEYSQKAEKLKTLFLDNFIKYEEMVDFKVKDIL